MKGVRDKKATQGRLRASRILRLALDRQMRRNPAYSMRSLALAMGISPSYLSRVLNGKKPVPEARFEALTRSLGMDGLSCRALREAMLRESIRGQKVAYEALQEIVERGDDASPDRVAEYREGTVSELSFLEPWYRMTIVDLVTCKDFDPNPQWIAERVGIRPEEAEKALKALLAEGIVKNEEGKWKKVAEKVHFPTARSHPAVRRYHKSRLEKAIRALMTETDDLAFERRQISTICFAADPRRIRAAKEKLMHALLEVAEYLAAGDCTEVYQLSVQLFPLTRPKK